jgi:hypothetical protein
VCSGPAYQGSWPTCPLSGLWRKIASTCCATALSSTGRFKTLSLSVLCLSVCKSCPPRALAHVPSTRSLEESCRYLLCHSQVPTRQFDTSSLSVLSCPPFCVQVLPTKGTGPRALYQVLGGKLPLLAVPQPQYPLDGLECAVSCLWCVCLCSGPAHQGSWPTCPLPGPGRKAASQQLSRICQPTHAIRQSTLAWLW